MKISFIMRRNGQEKCRKRLVKKSGALHMIFYRSLFFQSAYAVLSHGKGVDHSGLLLYMLLGSRKKLLMRSPCFQMKSFKT